MLRGTDDISVRVSERLIILGVTFVIARLLFSHMEMRLHPQNNHFQHPLKWKRFALTKTTLVRCLLRSLCYEQLAAIYSVSRVKRDNLNRAY